MALSISKIAVSENTMSLARYEVIHGEQSNVNVHAAIMRYHYGQ
jgi:hypothetical protein